MDLPALLVFSVSVRPCLVNKGIKMSPINKVRAFRTFSTSLFLSPMLSVGQQPTFLSGIVRVSLSSFFGGGAEQSKNAPKQMIVLEWLFLTIAPCDAAEPWQLGSQDAATPMMQGIIDLHHDIFFFLILILEFLHQTLRE
ncbi:hypothetical protein Ddye_008539 [Dipteronia dyeriana]|uniref:Cytochrome oxidase subunit II transmembrane region profile domain-containing protein n=1 Tax=Dipteronia dyeriana TaxID=168575 RepID=A0AAD9XA22_9ROSI|nr:hypothetical protein Ddye_008539 [Dipteronia dyeriana]